MKEPWGISTSIDLYNCNPKTIRNKKKIKEFTKQLCKLIDMKPFGKTTVAHFGQDKRVAGYSMMQLIETSLISAHFVEESNTVYLDIFSCKDYDSDIIASFAKGFFNAESYKLHRLKRE
ncbi:MAG: S-adenosylmethionine decarboxylase [Novosphingobium sp.]|jgi:S-adenosylmethionine/arginine decarboxylase-like enzyme|nr:S-adenosylmethionine decarboxylase [Novosphingobium sp.]